MLIPMEELNSRKPDIVGSNAKIYFLDDELLAKRFVRMKDYEKKDRLRRYEHAKTVTDLDELSLPVDILETERGFCGYIEKIIPGMFDGNLETYSDHYNKHSHDITLDDITAYMSKVCSAVDKCHKNGIINPDMASNRNVLFNPKTRDIHLIDYHDMQVGNITTEAISSFISFDPIIRSEKYYKNGIYTPNIDLYTLAIRFFYYATKIDVPRSSEHHYNIEELLDMAGISDTSFAECMRTLYNPRIDNLDIRESITELSENYKLSEFRRGHIRKLIKKR